MLIFHRRQHIETVNKEGSKSSSNGRPSLDPPLKPEELADINVDDLMKENLEISVKKLEIMSKRQIGVPLDDFVLKAQRKAINDNIEEAMRRQCKRLIKRNRGEDNNEQDGRLTFC